MLRFHIAPVPFVVACALSAYVDNSCAQGDLLPEPDIAKLVRVLEADSPTYAKAMACRRLALIGDRDAVPALAKLLSNSQLATYSRSALEAIPDAEADAALRAALSRLDGDLLVGVLNSIGKRRDREATAALARLLADDGTTVAAAAARALGHIGTHDAARALQAALVTAPAAKRSAIANACLTCAARLGERNDSALAIRLCDLVRRSDVPRQYVLAATRAAIITRGEDGLTLLAAQLKDDKDRHFRFALQTARQLGPRSTAVLLDALSTASTDRQVLLILAVADIGDPAAASAIAELAASDSARVRIEALRALARFRDPAAVPILLKAVTSADKVVAQAAGSTLADIESPEVDRAIVGMLRAGQPRTRLVATALVGKRHIAAATPVLLEFAKGSDPAQRQEAIVALGATAELNDLPQLIEMVATIRQSGDEALLSDALKAACSRLPQEAAAEIVAASIPGKPPEVKVALLEQLAAIGGATALDTVVAAAGDTNAALQDAATRLLGAWMTPDVAPALRDLAESLDNAKFRTRAIRGYIRVARQMEMTAAERLQMCRNALAIAERVEEKKLVLDAVAGMDSAEALQWAADQLPQVDLLPETAHSVLAVAARVLAAAPLEVEEALQRVVLFSTSPEIATRARTLLVRAREKTEAGFVSLFDGESLQGWEGNLDMFHVADGAIVGGSLEKDVPRNEFLCATQTYGDFELRLQFKIIGDKANAGVQLRSRRIPDHHEMIGYQADLGDGWWGCLYDESRRRKVLAGPEPSRRSDPVRINEWNDYRMRCVGKRIQLWINGLPTVDYTELDAEIDQEGLIAVQVHSGGPMQASYRHIRLKRL